MNLKELPKLRDSISYIYIDHARVEQDNRSLVFFSKDGRIPIPISTITCIMLGPGTSITQSAIKIASENGCQIIWCGDEMDRFYASGIGETHRADNLLLQAKLCMDKELHLQVVKRMYLRRFGDITDENLSIQQFRGMEGARVRKSYEKAAAEYGIEWNGRKYKSINWESSDSVNKALSYANTILYGICHSAIISLGFSPGLGFIHTGKQLSFVYDIADLYKMDVSVPAAFRAIRDTAGKDDLSLVRKYCRELIWNQKLMKRIPEDIYWIFQTIGDQSDVAEGFLWDVNDKEKSGINYGGSDDDGPSN